MDSVNEQILKRWPTFQSLLKFLVAILFEWFEPENIKQHILKTCHKKVIDNSERKLNHILKNIISSFTIYYCYDSTVYGCVVRAIDFKWKHMTIYSYLTLILLNFLNGACLPSISVTVRYHFLGYQGKNLMLVSQQFRTCSDCSDMQAARTLLVTNVNHFQFQQGK